MKKEVVKPFIKLEKVNKVYPNGVQAVFDFSLDINKEEFIVLVGPSGCGKSTTLRMVAGLEEITNGKLIIDDKVSNFAPPKNRGVAMVFQSYALYPNMNVYDNMAFGLKIKGVDREIIEKRVFYAANILDLGPYLDRRPKELSGGQMQRVALGRAIVRNMPIYLMDEPLSNLDAKLRVSMRAEIVKIHKAVKSTTIYVTHDQIEAMTMATRIVVMNKGFVQQIGTPEEIYTNPSNSFVAAFIGTPAMNIFRCKYNKGKILLDDGKELDATFDKKEYINYLKSTKDTIEKALEEITYDTITLEKRLDSNCAMLDAEKGTPFTVKKKQNKIKSFLLKLKSDNETKKLLKEEKRIQTLIDNYEESTDKTLAELNTELMAVREKLFEKRTKIEQKEIPEKFRLMELQDKIEHNIGNAHTILVGVRPESITLHPAKASDKDKIIVEADVVELLGAEYNVRFMFQGRNIICRMPNINKIEIGDKFVLDIDPEKLFVFDELTGNRIR